VIAYVKPRSMTLITHGLAKPFSRIPATLSTWPLGMFAGAINSFFWKPRAPTSITPIGNTSILELLQG
jgi:hypothetical protein